MRDVPVLADVSSELAKLADSLGKPYDADAKQMAEAYLRAFQFHGLPMSAVRDAIQEVAATWTKATWPKPGTIAEVARKHIPQTDAQRNRPEFPGDRCQRCGLEWFYAGWETPSRVVYPRRRCACPQRSPRWWTSAALAWRETDPRLPDAIPPDYATNARYGRPVESGPGGHAP